MDIVGDRKFVEVPGDKTHELPPLLVHTTPKVKRLDRVVGMATDLIDAEDMLPIPETMAGVESEVGRKMDLAINLADQYLRLITTWQWGDSILEWIRQCEITFGARLELRNLLRPDVWPHAGRASFVALLEDKAVQDRGYSFRQRRRPAAHVPPTAADFLLLRISSCSISIPAWRRRPSKLGRTCRPTRCPIFRPSVSRSTSSTCRRERPRR